MRRKTVHKAVKHGRSFAQIAADFMRVLSEEGETNWEQFIEFFIKNGTRKHEHIFYFTDDSKIKFSYEGDPTGVDRATVQVESTDVGGEFDE